MSRATSSTLHGSAMMLLTCLLAYLPTRVLTHLLVARQAAADSGRPWEELPPGGKAAGGGLGGGGGSGGGGGGASKKGGGAKAKGGAKKAGKLPGSNKKGKGGPFKRR